MRKKIKVLSGSRMQELQRDIDNWTEIEKPNIINQSCAITELNGFPVAIITILYWENNSKI